MNSLTTIWHSQVAADSLSELIEITVEGCDKLVTLFPPGTVRSFQNLEVLKIRRCSALKVVYEIEENAGSDLPGLVAITKLKELSLADLANLQHIWRTDPKGILSFQNLSSASVMGCSSLRYLFHASVAQALVQLVELKVTKSSLEVIVAKDEGMQPASTLEFVFPRATKLELSDLSQLKSFYPGKYISRWPSLRELMISKSNKVEIFAFDSKKSQAIIRNGNQAEQPLFLVDKGTFSNVETLHMQHNDNMKQIIWSGRNRPKLTCFSSGVHFHFANLTTLKVENCCSLKNILTPNMVSELPWLATLEIRDCAMLEAVIVREKKARKRNIRLAKLRYITLESLPMLVSFCPHGCLIQCPSLTEMAIKNCPEMRRFTSPHLKEKVSNAMDENSKESYSNSGDIDIPQEAFFNEKLGMIWGGQVTEDCFSKLKEITVQGCDALVTIFPPFMVRALWKLEKLMVESCSSLEVIYDMQGLTEGSMEYSDHVVVGTQLKELRLSDLLKLEHIWNTGNPGRILSFHNLDSVEVEKCESLKYLFPPSVAKVLYNLSELVIEDNRGLEEIVTAAVDEEVETTAGTSEFVFPRATRLKLCGLPGLKSFCQRRHISKWPSLKTLQINRCDSIQNLFCGIDLFQDAPGNGVGSPNSQQTGLFLLDKVSFPRLEELTISGMEKLGTIWCTQITGDYFSKLTEITVESCDALVTIFPPCMVRALWKLEKLMVESCSSLEVIYDMQGLTEGSMEYSDHVVVGTQLKELSLSDLLKLEHIWNTGNPGRILSFHNLDSVEVEKCESLKYLFPPSVAKVLYNLSELVIEDNRGLEEIVTAAVDEEVETTAGTSEFVFPRATRLKLCGLPGLKSFCQRRHISKWPSLKTLQINRCDSIQNLFCGIDLFQDALCNSNDVNSPPQRTLFLVDKVLYNLSELVIEDNRGLEEIVAASVDEEVETVASTSEFVFPRATRLRLCGLPGLKSFCQRRHISKWPSLKTLQINRCDSIQNLFCEIDLFQEAPDNCNDVGSSPQRTLFLVDKVSFIYLERLEISEMNRLVTLFPPGTVRSFQNLEVLSIESCGALEMVYNIEENADSDLPSPATVTKLEKLSLTDLAKLQHIWRTDPRGILSFQNLSSVSVMGCSSLGYLFHASVAKALVLLVELEVRESSLEVIVAKDEGMQPASTLEFVFPRATKLELSDLSQLKSFYPGKYISRWPSLRELMISKSNKVEIFAFDSKKSQAITRNGNQAEQPLFLVDKGTFSNVETLHMQHNDNMKQIIWSGRNRPKLTCFSSGVHFHFVNLTTLKVENCRSFENILTPNMVSEIPCLATLEIRDCAMLKAVIVGEKKARKRNFRLGKLRCITLESLPELVQFPSLQILVLSHMESLSMIWHDVLAEKSFDKLRDVKIYHCRKLMRIFPPKTALERFRNLEKLRIAYCDSLEVVFDIAGQCHDPVIKMSLRKLCLSNLPKLRSVCNADIGGTISFDSLKPVRDIACPKLENSSGIAFTGEESQDLEESSEADLYSD
ncbi:hypothetical protein CDL15_Pgr017804 [Punica granatum]|uniref:Disease resistance protein At4g27190-like leucine-rich repeats domain-containing protein n=1 Tax=Punica granatum TaxID=22663 RepID=A0A218WI67_PUNGR|nr:hypothetical protein CDL15_Pgr017804 [Punica granatum]